MANSNMDLSKMSSMDLKILQNRIQHQLIANHVSEEKLRVLRVLKDTGIVCSCFLFTDIKAPHIQVKYLLDCEKNAYYGCSSILEPSLSQLPYVNLLNVRIESEDIVRLSFRNHSRSSTAEMILYIYYNQKKPSKGNKLKVIDRNGFVHDAFVNNDDDVEYTALNFKEKLSKFSLPYLLKEK